MKHNPKRCVFRARSGKLLGFMIISRVIDANPDKVKGVLDMRLPWNIKEVQRLIGSIAALGRFMSKLTDKCQPFFPVL